MILKGSAFVRPGFVRHAGAEQRGQHFLRYHVYVIREGTYLKHSVPLAYVCSLWGMVGLSVVETAKDEDREK